jgi:ABC-type lipoprotein export system ATPase subunit
MAIAGERVKYRRQRSSYILSELKLTDKALRLPAQLSGGEQQRVAIGVAMSNSPPLLLADEPTGELDTQMAIDIFDLLRKINRDQGTTIVIVSHYQNIAQHVDRVVHIRDGRISSESFVANTFDKSQQSTEYEYVVIDEAGRLQLPAQILNKTLMPRLAIVESSDKSITLLNPDRSQL